MTKQKKKIFQQCYCCKHKNDCKAGKQRLISVGRFTEKEVGCYDYEMRNRQLQFNINWGYYG